MTDELEFLIKNYGLKIIEERSGYFKLTSEKYKGIYLEYNSDFPCYIKMCVDTLVKNGKSIEKFCNHLAIEHIIAFDDYFDFCYNESIAERDK